MARSRVKGMKKWNKWIEKITPEVEQETKDLVAVTAYKVEADAKMLAPVDTGHLRRSIKTDIKDGGFSATVGTNVDYAGYVEFGTSKQHEQPFLIPAFLNHKDDFEKELKKIADKVGD